MGNATEIVKFRTTLVRSIGSWKTIFNRFNRWSKKGYFEIAFDMIKKNGDEFWVTTAVNIV